MTQQFYMGHVKNSPVRRVFTSETTPTEESHGNLYASVVGPFKTKRGARFMALYGNNNPHIQTVADAEYWAKQTRGQGL